MRQDTLVYFVTEGKEVYDPTTGDYIDGEPIRDEVYALVTDTGTQRMNLLYGGIKQYAKTIRLNQVYTDDFDYVELSGRMYQVDMKRTYRHKTTFEVSGL